ncbi:MAG: G5 domain-containing protein [Eubacteriales bacterium]|jgi:3D (Asp-Asp-Asp) domain-containing protein|nr:G5 domain-containing protein [Eubacteriales bacterium]
MHLLDNDAKPRPTWRLIVLLVFILTIGAMTVSGLVYAMSKQVSIVDDDGYYEAFVTYKKTTADVLEEKGIVLREKDEVNFDLDEVIKDGAQIVVSRAVAIQIVDGNETYFVRTAKKKIADLLAAEGIEVGENTVLNVEPDDVVFEGMTVTITHTSEEIVTLEEVIPFKITKKPSSKLKAGETKVVQEGSEGLLEKQYKVYYENNKEVSRELLNTKVIVPAVDKVIHYGEAAPATVAVAYTPGTIASRGGELRYKGVITASASAYCIKGRTATGIPTKVGVVAVDPKVIPLGSRLYIEAADGSWTYGNAIAADTGGAIKGNKVDLYVETYSEAINFGIRKAKVYILE